MHPVNMKGLKDFKKIILAEDQPEYIPLPALINDDAGYVLTEWQLAPEEIEKLKAGGRLRVYTYNFGQPFQPIALQVVTSSEALELEPVS